MKKVIGAVVIVIIVVVAIVLVASHKSKTPASNTPSPTASISTSPTTSPSASASPSASSASTAQSVTISNYAFSPAKLTVKKGTTVTWTNKDSVAHTVTETDGKSGPNSTDLNQGQTYSFTFNSVGTFSYDCSIHPYMTGTVTVTD